MLPNGRTLAKRRLIQAFFQNGTLALFATGEVPSACHTVILEQGQPGIEPPHFSLLQYRRTGMCSESATPYTVSRLFSMGEYHSVIQVTHADGADELSVEFIRERPPSGSSERDEDMPVPYVLPPSSRAVGDTSTATGYSERFDFTEALQHAIAALPPAVEPYPDQLSVITVVDVGVELGGIAGFRHLFVRVRREVGNDARSRR